MHFEEHSFGRPNQLIFFGCNNQTKFDKMEISPTARQEYDSPSKHSSTTIRPADKCVISYNFEQNNSHNYTHNLLIGMGHQECKKSAKKSVNTSVEHCKSKIAHIWKSNQKSFKHYPEVITKTYQSNVVVNMLNQAQSPRKSSQMSKENASFRDNSQENGHRGSRFRPFNQESYFQKQNWDFMMPEGSFLTNPLKEEFNQEKQRKKSPYYSKFQYQKQKKAGAKRSKDFSNEGEKIDERDHSRSRDSRQNIAKQGKKVMKMIINTFKTKHEGSKAQSNNNTTYNNSSSMMKKYNPLAQSLKGFLYVPGVKVDKSSRMNSFNIKKKENNSKNKSQFSKSKTKHSEEDITQNNVIKGYKMPPWKIQQQISPLAAKNNQQSKFTNLQIKSSNQQNKRKPQVLLNPVVSDTNLKNKSPLVSDAKLKNKSPVVSDAKFKNKSPVVSDTKLKNKSPVVSDTRPKNSSVVSDTRSKNKSPVASDTKLKNKSPVISDTRPKNNSSLISNTKSKNKSPLVSDTRPKKNSSVISDTKLKNKSPVVSDTRPKKNSPVVSDKRSKKKSPVFSDTKSKDKSPVVSDKTSQLNSAQVIYGKKHPERKSFQSTSIPKNNQRDKLNLKQAPIPDQGDRLNPKQTHVPENNQRDRLNPKKTRIPENNQRDRLNPKQAPIPDQGDMLNPKQAPIPENNQGDRLNNKQTPIKQTHIPENDQRDRLNPKQTFIHENDQGDRLNNKQTPVLDKGDRLSLKQAPIPENDQGDRLNKQTPIPENDQGDKLNLKQTHIPENDQGDRLNAKQTRIHENDQGDTLDPKQNPIKQTSIPENDQGDRLNKQTLIPDQRDRLNLKQTPIPENDQGDTLDPKQIPSKQTPIPENDQGDRLDPKQTFIYENDQGDRLNLKQTPIKQTPIPENEQGDRLNPKQTPISENETDYHEEYLDKIGDMLPPEQRTKSQDFFQYNLNQSKVSFSEVNNTKYENVDKDTSNYTRAPILSFLYEIPKKSYSKNVPFEPSTCINEITKRIEKSIQIDDAVIDEAVSILLSIDPWIIQRILEPFEDKDGKTGIWLYCHGQWTLFLENREQAFRSVLKSAVEKGLNQIGEPYVLEPVLKLISGVRIMRLKGSKKRIFSELEYSLKKGHILKVLTSKQSKWGNKMFSVTKVQVANDNQNLVQIKYDNDKYWIKEDKFKEIFDHFLLICARQSHFWTHRLLEHKDDHKIVLNLMSDVPTHGSITIFYPSNKPSSLMLYKQFDAGMLKYIGMIEEKPNQNGNLYFQFKLHGNYSLFLQTPNSCLLAIESTSPLEIGAPEYIQSESLKNRECEYVELKKDREKVRQTKLKESRLRQTKLRDTKLRETSGSRRDESLEIIKEIFINMVVKK